MKSKRVCCIRVYLLLAVCLGCACIIAGCSSDTGSNQEQTTGSPGENTLIEPETLAQYLPDAPEGWISQPIMQGTMPYEQSTYAAVEGVYQSDSSQVTIDIYDSAPFMHSQYENLPSNGEINGYSVKTKEVDTGSDGMQVYDCLVKVNDRIIVEAIVYGGPESDMQLFLGRIDYNGLSKL